MECAHKRQRQTKICDKIRKSTTWKSPATFGTPRPTPGTITESAEERPRSAISKKTLRSTLQKHTQDNTMGATASRKQQQQHNQALKRTAARSFGA